MQKSRRPCAVWEEAFNGVKAYWPLRLGRQSLGQRIKDSVCRKGQTEAPERTLQEWAARMERRAVRWGGKGERVERMRDLLKR